MLLLFIFIHSKRYLTLQLKHCLFVVCHSTTIALHHRRQHTTFFFLFTSRSFPLSVILAIHTRFFDSLLCAAVQVSTREIISWRFSHIPQTQVPAFFSQWIFQHIKFTLYRYAVLTGTVERYHSSAASRKSETSMFFDRKLLHLAKKAASDRTLIL